RCVPGHVDGEEGGVDAAWGHRRDVAAVAVVVVAGDVAGVAAADPAGRVAELVPDRPAPAVLVDGPLDLVGGGGHAPDEVRSEVRYVTHGPHPAASPRRPARGLAPRRGGALCGRAWG